jgi:ABC-type nitrate/sulfonate/bicarbonate transport system substrate-binding protein
MRKTTRTSFVAGSTALAASALASRRTAAQGMTTVRFADQIGSEVDYAAVWVAEHQGYFKDVGIVIHRDTYSNGPEGLLHFANGEEDGMVGGFAPFMEAAARGTKYVMVMSVTKNNAPLVGSKAMNGYPSLNGKNVGSPGIGTVQDAILSYAEKKFNITFKRQFAKVTSFVPMMQNKEIDAFISWEPAAATAIGQDSNLHYIAQNPPIPNAESLELIFAPQFVAQHKEVVRNFVKATLKGIEYIKTHPTSDVAKIIAAKMGQPSATSVVEMALKSVVLTEPKLDMPSSRIILRTLADSGKIPKEIGADPDAFMKKVIDYSYL